MDHTSKKKPLTKMIFFAMKGYQDSTKY